MTSIAAHTPNEHEGYYPPYVSINRRDTGIEITVRSAVQPNGDCGSSSSITMDEGTFRQLLVEAIRNIGQTAETVLLASALIDEQSFADLRALGGIAQCD